jgi:hypothetical protein
MATSRIGCGITATLVVLLYATASMAGDRREPTPKTSPAKQPSFIVRQQLEAEVREVDATVGVLSLKTEAGRLRLRNASGAAMALRKGDPVALDIGLIRHPDPAGLPRRAETPLPLMAQRLPATISSIQRTVEVIVVNTSAGEVTLPAPSEAIKGLHTGDSVWLELAVRPERDPSALASAEPRRRSNSFTSLLFMLFGSGK